MSIKTRVGLLRCYATSLPAIVKAPCGGVVGGLTAAEAPASSQANSQTHPFNYYLLLRVNAQFKFGYAIHRLVQTWENNAWLLAADPPP